MNGEDTEPCLGTSKPTPVTIDWDGQTYVWVGRILAVKMFGVEMFIGPHWYCSIIMLLIILGAGGFFTFVLATQMNALHMVGGVLVTVASTTSFLRCAFADPGLLQPRLEGPRSLQEQIWPSTGERMCQTCGIVQPSGTLHCGFCQVCVIGYDHHCPWMSKCIGKSNLSYFYNFLCVGFSSLAYIVVATIMSPRALS